MKPVVPFISPENAKFIELGLGQEGVDVLPCYKTSDGILISEREITPREAARLLAGGRIRMMTMIGDQKFQPVAFEVV